MEKRYLARYPIGNPRRLWRQEEFIHTTANPGKMGSAVLKGRATEAPIDVEKTRRAVKTCIDAGFNVLELCWATPATGSVILEEAERLGARVLYQDLTRFGGMGHKNVFCATNDLLGAMRDTAKWRSIMGYYMWDEPTTPEQLEETHRMIELCERERPELLPFTVGLPSYNRHCLWEDGAYVDYIDRFADVIDPAQLSFDYYPIGRAEHNATVQLDESRIWCDLEVVRRAAQKRSIPFWFAYQGQNLHYEPFFIFPMTRLMANAAILHGVKALEHYTAWIPVIDPETGGPGPFFEDQKLLNAEISALGNTLMALECERVIHDSTLLPECPYMEGLRTPIEESGLLSGNLPYRVSVSEHRDAYGNRYLMVLNRDYLLDRDISVTLKVPSRVYKVSREDGEERLVYENATALYTRLRAGDLALYRIQPMEEAPYTLSYCLQTGAV